MLPLIHRLAADTGIPLVATNDSHYLRKDDARAHEILLCIQTGKTMSDPNRMRFEQPAFYLKSRDEMMALFGEVEARARPDLGHRAALPGEARAGRRSRSRNSPFRRGTRPTAFSNTSRGRDSRSAACAWKPRRHRAI